MKNVNEGHRSRLRERFLKSGLRGFHDYEIIELLLTLGTPRKDCKQIAKEALLKFGNLNAVLDASINDLLKIKGLGPVNIFGLKLSQAVSEIYQEKHIERKLRLDSPDDIYNYLKEKIGNEPKENFIILFFDIKNKLITDTISIGTLNTSLVHPREVFSKAILHNTSHVVIAHNHPSGDPTPSQDDIETTKRLIKAGEILGITIVDHIIISKSKYLSLKLEFSELFF